MKYCENCGAELEDSAVSVMNVVQELRLCHKKSSRFRAKQGSRKTENAVIDPSDKQVEKENG